MKTTIKLVRRTFYLLLFTHISCSQNNTRNTDFEGVWLYQMDKNEPDRFMALTIESSDTGYEITYNSKGNIQHDEKIKAVVKGEDLHFINLSKDSIALKINRSGKLVFIGKKDGYEFTKQKEGFQPLVNKFHSTSDITLSDFEGEWIEEKDDADEWKDKIRISVRNGVIKIDPYEISSCPYVFEFAQGKYHKNTIRAKRVQFGGGSREVSDTKLTISKDGKLTVKNLAQYPCGRREIVFIKK